MSVLKYLETKPIFDLAKYEPHPDLERDCIAFVGAPRKHPYDEEKILLVIDPFSSHTAFYEFLIRDIRHVDKEPNIATDGGENLAMMKLWVGKGTRGVKILPFEVADPIRFLHDSELLHQSEGGNGSGE
jgi:hypothetical protein